MGNKKNNIIEINGKRYDARTGAPLGGYAQSKPETPISTVSIAESIPVRHAHHSPGHSTATSHKAARRPAKATKSHSPEHSKTLMRHTVKKPAPGLKRRIKAYSSTDNLLKKTSTEIAPKHSAKKVDSNKLSHAGRVPKSPSVQRFSKTQPISISVPVTVKKPTAKEPAPVHHARARHQAAAPKHFSSTSELLNHALQHATSHQEPPPKKVTKRRRGLSRRITSITALSVAALVLGGFIAYGNLASVRLKVASAKAGFNASLPGQSPAGYHLSHLNYSPGVVSMHFSSNSDDRNFAITEKASAWNSGTLRDTYLASTGQDYQTVESGGRTLYILGKNAATWVSGGVWYQVHSSGALSSRQLVDLATSM